MIRSGYSESVFLALIGGVIVLLAKLNADSLNDLQVIGMMWISGMFLAFGVAIFVFFAIPTYLRDLEDATKLRSDPSFNPDIGKVKSVNSKADIVGKLALCLLIGLAVIQAL